MNSSSTTHQNPAGDVSDTGAVTGVDRAASSPSSMRPALLVIDMQEDFCPPVGATYQPTFPFIAANDDPQGRTVPSPSPTPAPSRPPSTPSSPAPTSSTKSLPSTTTRQITYPSALATRHQTTNHSCPTSTSAQRATRHASWINVSGHPTVSKPHPARLSSQRY